MKNNIPHERPISIYNADEHYLIAIFKQPCLVMKYLFGKGSSGMTNLNSAIRYKTRICTSNYPARVAVRFANDEQMKTIGENDFFIHNDILLKFNERLLTNFHSSRASMYKDHALRK